MTFNKIFDAYKEAIFAGVDKREYDTVEILHASMKLLSNSLESRAVNTNIKSTPVTTTKVDAYQSGVTTKEIESFIIDNLKSGFKLTSSDAITLYQEQYQSKFTEYDCEITTKGDPRWKTRFWNVAHYLRKSGVLMPNKGKYALKYVLNPNHQAEN